MVEMNTASASLSNKHHNNQTEQRLPRCSVLLDSSERAILDPDGHEAGVDGGLEGDNFVVGAQRAPEDELVAAAVLHDAAACQAEHEAVEFLARELLLVPALIDQHARVALFAQNQVQILRFEGGLQGADEKDDGEQIIGFAVQREGIVAGVLHPLEGGLDLLAVAVIQEGEADVLAALLVRIVEIERLHVRLRDIAFGRHIGADEEAENGRGLDDGLGMIGRIALPLVRVHAHVDRGDLGVDGAPFVADLVVDGAQRFLGKLARFAQGSGNQQERKQKEKFLHILDVSCKGTKTMRIPEKRKLWVGFRKNRTEVIPFFLSL